MRVLHVNMTLDPTAGGGTAERTVQLARALARVGAECAVLSLDVGATRARSEQLAPARLLTLRCLSVRFYLPLSSPARVLAAVRAADVVSLMGHWTALNALVYAAARVLGRPHVVCPAGALPVYGRSALLKRLYNALGGRALVRGAAGHVAVTAAERAQFAAYGVDPEAVTVIPNGVDLVPTDEPGDALDLPVLDGRPFVAFVGRLNPIKGPDLLVEAFARAHDALAGCQLLLVGPDEGMRADLERRAERAGVADRVHFAGPLHGAAKAAVYRRCVLLAVPSRQEAMSLVALEAGAAGRPVLLTDACGFDEVAAIGGGLVVPASVAGLEQGLRRLLGSPPAELERTGRRLRALVQATYTWDQAAAQYLAVYERALHPQPAAVPQHPAARPSR